MIASIGRMTRYALVVVTSLTGALFGCILPEETKCYEVPGDPETLRNPYTGECETFGGGHTTCDGPIEIQGAAGDELSLAPLPPWGACSSAQCDFLDEAACNEQAGCQSAYVIDPGLDGPASPTFLACWPTAMAYDSLPPLPPAPACSGLLADACVTRDDCRLLYHYGQALDYGQEFASCIQEPSLAPPPLEIGLCYASSTCDLVAPLCPQGTLPGVAESCWTGYCIPVDACEPPPACEAMPSEEACQSREDCVPLYHEVSPICGPSDPCEYEFWGCATA